MAWWHAGGQADQGSRLRELATGFPVRREVRAPDAPLPDPGLPRAPRTASERWATPRRAVAAVALAVLLLGCGAGARIWRASGATAVAVPEVTARDTASRAATAQELGARPDPGSEGRSRTGGGPSTGMAPSTGQIAASPGAGGGTGGGAGGGAGEEVVGGTGAAGTTLLVHVVGRVRRPGLVRLAPGARVADAVEAAGGAAKGADVSAVSLARRIEDGEQLVVPEKGRAVAAGPVTQPGSGGSGGGGTVSLSTASAEQLDTLPGIGPVLAARIVEWRSAHGPFSRVEDLVEVPGIGERLLAQLRERVTP